MDLRPTIIIASLAGTLLVVIVIGILYRVIHKRHRRKVTGYVADEAEIPVRKLIIWKGRVVPEYCKPSVIADRARAWTDRVSWLPGDIYNTHMEKKAQRQSPSPRLPWPMSKYNPVRQHNTKQGHVHHTRQNTHSRQDRGTERHKIHNKSNNPPHTQDSRSPQLPKPVAASERRSRHSRAVREGSSSIANARKLARNLERAYEGPTSQKRSKPAHQPPAIVVTQDPLVHLPSRSKALSIGPNQGKTTPIPVEVTPYPERAELRFRLAYPSTVPPPKKRFSEAPQRRRVNGRAEANSQPVSPVSPVAVSVPPTSSQKQLSPEVSLPPSPLLDPSLLQIQRPLARSSNTLRSNNRTRARHRSREQVGQHTSVSQTTKSSVLDSASSDKHHGNARSGQALTSPKSTTTLNSSDTSETCSLGNATPVPIVPVSRINPSWKAGRNKPLPLLPIMEDLGMKESMADRTENSGT